MRASVAPITATAMSKRRLATDGSRVENSWPVNLRQFICDRPA
ncbi:hypothetical protein RTCIAT899_PC07905 (plasmid) [Rhizobium tropici CIAT 899]|nr:hypothetical protein RTCIAT899_PC07905 [Rhizobium tropici CIAT 899]